MSDQALTQLSAINILSQTISCSLCLFRGGALELIAHGAECLAKCYSKLPGMTNDKRPCLCTSCEGKMPHPTSSPNVVKSLASGAVPRRIQFDEKDPTTLIQNIEQHRGTNCLCCGKSTPPSTCFVYVRLGECPLSW